MCPSRGRAASTTLIAIAVALALACLPGCQTTTVSTVWTSPDGMPQEPFEKVVTLVLNTTPAERRSGEDAMARSIKRSAAVPAYTIVPDEMLGDREHVRSVLEREGIDGAIVMRLVSSEKRTEYVPPSMVNSSGGIYNGPTAFYQYRDYPVYSPGYTVTDTIIRTEVSIYSVHDEKLLWAGSGDCENPSSIGDLVQQIAKASVEELTKQGLLKK